MSNCIALIPAAGSGSRIGSELPKQYLPLAGKPMIWHAISALAKHERIEWVYVVLAPGDSWFDSYDWSGIAGKLRVLRCGGDTRAASVLNGLRAMQADVGAEDWVLVHDAARPCLTQAHLDHLITTLEHDPVGGILAVNDQISAIPLGAGVDATGYNFGELGVRVIKVGTLFERMSYDQDSIAIGAGKPVEFVFEPPKTVGNPPPEKVSTSERLPLLQKVESVHPIVASVSADAVAALNGLEVS